MCAARWRWLDSNALGGVWSDKDSICIIVGRPVKDTSGLACGVWVESEAVSSMPASRASPVLVVLYLIVAKETDLIAALARPEILVGHVHVLHTKWAACHGRNGFVSELMSHSHDSLA